MIKSFSEVTVVYHKLLNILRVQKIVGNITLEENTNPGILFWLFLSSEQIFAVIKTKQRKSYYMLQSSSLYNCSHQVLMLQIV